MYPWQSKYETVLCTNSQQRSHLLIHTVPLYIKYLKLMRLHYPQPGDEGDIPESCTTG